MTEISGIPCRHQLEHKRSKVRLDADPDGHENEKDLVVPHGGYETESEVIAAVDLRGWSKTDRYADHNAARLQTAQSPAHPPSGRLPGSLPYRYCSRQTNATSKSHG